MSDTDGPNGLVYSAKTRLIGPGTRFHLHDGMLDWIMGTRAGSLALADVVSVRLTFSLGQLGAAHYYMQVRGKAGEHLKVGSMSRKSVTSFEDNGAAYAAFVRAFHAALPRTVRFEAGLPTWRWRLTGLVGAVTVGCLLWLFGKAAVNGQWAMIGLLLLLCPMLAWPLGQTLWRNSPALYSPSSLPARLLPG